MQVPACRRRAAVTITGCLREEKDVPGRTANAAERAGMGEDYILTNVKMGQGSSTSGIGLAQMYQVEGLDDAELKKHIGHQVEVQGRLPMRAGAGDNDLPEIHATSIRMVAATCPAQ
jgi:hypothetical protein